MAEGKSVTNLNVLQLDGVSEVVGSTAVTVLLRDPAGLVLFAVGTTVPTGAGYAKSALFIDTDVAAGTGALYLNKGSTASASFGLVTQA